MGKTLKSMLAGALLGIGCLSGGYVGADYQAKTLAAAIETAREEGLEKILSCTYRLTNETEYDYTSPPAPDADGNVPEVRPEDRDVRQDKSGGSATAIHRDSEGFVYFLTSNHVVYNEDEINIRKVVHVPFPMLIAETGKFVSGKYTIQTESGEVEVERIASTEDIIDDVDFEKDIDLCLLKSKTPLDIPIWEGEFAEQEELSSGDLLYSAGFAGPWNKHLVAGVIRNPQDPHVPDTLYPTTLPINFGNSGGGTWVLHIEEGMPTYKFAGVNRMFWKGISISGVSSPRYIKLFLEENNIKLYGGDKQE